MATGGTGKSHSLHGFASEITLTAFLGGLTFTGMVVIMQSDDKFDFIPFSSLVYYPEILISSIGLVSALFIFATVIFTDDSSERNEKVQDFAEWLAIFGIIGILILVPFLILPFSLIGAIIIGVLEVIIMVKWFRIDKA